MKSALLLLILQVLSVNVIATGIAVNDTITSPEDFTFEFDVAANDTLAAEEVYVFSLVSTPTGTINWNENGTFEYTPETNYFGNITFQYALCNELSECDTATVHISILSVNDAPVVTNETYTTDEEQPLTGTVAGNDTDVETTQLLYHLMDDVQQGELSFSSNGEFAYSPYWNFNGEVIFNYWCCDAAFDGECTPGQVVITVLPVNDLPVAYAQQKKVCKNTMLSYDLTSSSTDIDGQTISLMSANCDNGTVDFETDGTYQFLPDVDFVGTTTINFEICDSNDPPGCDSGTQTVIVVDDVITIDSLYIESQSCIGINDGLCKVYFHGGLGSYNIAFTSFNNSSVNNGIVYKNKLQSGTYILTIDDNNDCAPPATIEITIPLDSSNALHLNETLSNINCYDQTADVQLDISGGLGSNYTAVWPGGITGMMQPNVQEGNYPIIVSDDEGCVETVPLKLLVPDCTLDQLFIPEGFSPDGDGVNDVFEMPGIAFFPDNHLTIFNQWGIVVFDWEQYAGHWNGYDTVSGKLLPAGTYYYVLSVNGHEDMKGSVIIQY
ncbi:MAG: Ig-like domain-containing protein [Flavobacteriales bacterium]